jgi:diguanylate cyclase (GGDEF)-like protein
LFVDSFNFPNLDQAGLERAIMVNVALPLFLAAPMLAFLMSKLRELAIAKHELTVLASTDSLTAVLNRGAFQLIVDSYLEKVQIAEVPAQGTLLVVDVDFFKSINDDLGHHQGDAALKLIAGAIKDAVRNIDLVGRIGGEEFGVFLPSLGPEDANSIAERIRSSITEVTFPPGSTRHLSVSVGGASFSTYVPFEALFRAADEHLYKAKRAGRNRVEMYVLAA